MTRHRSTGHGCREHRPSTITTGPITLTGNQSTDLKNVASAINEALGSSYGIVATVNAAGTGIEPEHRQWHRADSHGRVERRLAPTRPTR